MNYVCMYVCTKTGKNLMAITYVNITNSQRVLHKWPLYLPKFSVPRTSQLYQIWDFGMQLYVPSGIPGDRSL
jgi:hypothetical protein